jgi:hypothetical protein
MGVHDAARRDVVERLVAALTGAAAHR